ncbi:hypothetical protein SRABI02_03295 [Plantibacter cousiniae]|nr:hypothetical protein SRABI02_03295 [Plantibacter cousiniae]
MIGIRLTPPRKVFVSLTGDFTNIGDAVIRRQSLAWARKMGEIRAYVGGAPEEWFPSVGLMVDDHVVRTKANVRHWISDLIRSRRPVFVFDPGEVPLDHGNFRREVVYLALTLLVRAKRGYVVRPPRAVARPTRVNLALHRLASRASQVCLWRTREDAARLRTGRPSPDIGFSMATRVGSVAATRTVLAVSLRWDRPMPEDPWFQAVRDFAADNGFSIEVVSQVYGDVARSRDVAARLNASHDDWSGKHDLAHEAFVREVYDRSRIVISDRLHVLVVAATSGVVPAQLIPNPVPKVAANFRAVGYEQMTLNSSISTIPEMADFLSAQLTRHDELDTAFSAAGRELETIERQFLADASL